LYLTGSQHSAKGAQHPSLLGRCLLWPRSPISDTAELLFYLFRSINLSAVSMLFCFFHQCVRHILLCITAVAFSCGCVHCTTWQTFCFSVLFVSFTLLYDKHLFEQVIPTTCVQSVLRSIKLVTGSEYCLAHMVSFAFSVCVKVYSNVENNSPN